MPRRSAYGKAPWGVQDRPQDRGQMYRQMGRQGLDRIDTVGLRLAEGFDWHRLVRYHLQCCDKTSKPV